MNDLLKNDRVRTLLREAEDAQRLVDRMGESGDDAKEVREALEGIWRDLGRHVHATWRELLAAGADAPAEPAPVVRTASSDDDFDFGPGPDDQSEELDDVTDLPEVTAPPQGQGADEDLERWYTDEVDWDGAPEPIFNPGELEDALPATTEIVSAEGRVVANDGAIPDLRADGAVAGAEPFVLPEGDPPEWLGDLRELLEMLRPQDDPAATEAERLSVEASRVQWATTNMELRWAEFPEPVRVALVGLLAARARHLQDRLEVDVGPRLALDRLQRYRKAAGLSPVVGLLPDLGPESGSWTDDAERWWKALSDALHTRA